MKVACVTIDGLAQSQRCQTIFFLSHMYNKGSTFNLGHLTFHEVACSLLDSKVVTAIQFLLLED